MVFQLCVPLLLFDLEGGQIKISCGGMVKWGKIRYWSKKPALIKDWNFPAFGFY